MIEFTCTNTATDVALDRLLGSSWLEYRPLIQRAGSIVLELLGLVKVLGVRVLPYGSDELAKFSAFGIRGYPSNHHRLQLYCRLVSELLYQYVRAIVLAPEVLWSPTVTSSYCGTSQSLQNLMYYVRALRVEISTANEDLATVE